VIAGGLTLAGPHDKAVLKGKKKKSGPSIQILKRSFSARG